MLDVRAVLEGKSHVFGDRPAPAFEVYSFYRPGLRKFEVAVYVVDLMLKGREPNLALEDAHLVEIDIEHCLGELGEKDARCLHPVPVGNIYKIYFSCHITLSRFRIFRFTGLANEINYNIEKYWKRNCYFVKIKDVF